MSGPCCRQRESGNQNGAQEGAGILPTLRTNVPRPGTQSDLCAVSHGDSASVTLRFTGQLSWCRGVCSEEDEGLLGSLLGAVGGRWQRTWLFSLALGSFGCVLQSVAP